MTLRTELQMPPTDWTTQTVVNDPLEVALSEFREDLRAGRAKSIRHYEECFPDFAEELRDLIPSIAALERVSAHSVDEFQRRNAPPRIGGYEVTEEIGRGGMAVVYEARDPKLGRTVALKVLPFSSALNELSVLRFRHEAQILAQIDHPNIVPVYESGQHDGASYLAMKRIRGVPLDDVFTITDEGMGRSNGSEEVVADQSASAEVTEKPVEPSILERVRSLIPTDESVRLRFIATLGADAARALNAAHECGIIHRDIKPSNLMLDENGQLWVTDFGLAFAQQDDKVTQTGQLLGTVRYMSPEQSRGERSLVDQQSDIYSLGITLYELVTGQAAFCGNPIEILDQVKDTVPVAPRKLNSDIPRDLENIILKCCGKSRNDRYETARQVAEDLERFLAGETTIARRPSFTERVLRWTAKRRRTMTAIVSVAAILLVASVATTGIVLNEMTKTEAALELARENFQETQEVVDRFGLQLDGELALIPGTDHLRRSMLSNVIDHYRGFINRSERSEGLTENLALTLNKVASLTERVGTPAEALAAHDEARAAFEQLLKSDPYNDQWQSGLALCDNNIGLLFANNGNFAAADKHYKKAVEVFSELTSTTPGGLSSRELGLAWNNVGLLRIQQGKTAEAVEVLGRARDVLTSFNSAQPGDEQGQRYLAAALENLAGVTGRHSLADARKAHQQALDIQRKLAESHPNRMDLRQQLAVSYDSFGLMLEKLNQYPDAAMAFSNASRIQRDLLGLSPNSSIVLRQLAWSENHHGQSLARLGRVSDATSVLRVAVESQQRVCDMSGRSQRDLATLGGIWNNLGYVFEGQQDHAAASDAYRRAVETLSASVVDGEATDRDRNALHTAQMNLERIQSGVSS